MHPEVEEEAEIKEIEGGLDPRIEISINMDLLVLGFYGYIGNIGEISMDIFHQISVRQKLFKIHENI